MKLLRRCPQDQLKSGVIALTRPANECAEARGIAETQLGKVNNDLARTASNNVSQTFVQLRRRGQIEVARESNHRSVVIPVDSDDELICITVGRHRSSRQLSLVEDG